MPNVNACIRYFVFGRWARVFAAVLLVTFFYVNGFAQTDAVLNANCEAWHQKALAGHWFTKQEGSDFSETENIETKLESLPGCNAFLKLQRKCQIAFNAPDVAEVMNKSAAERQQKKMS